ncbi:MAG: ABC transporter ATP-binding protein [Stackebrandtia sp.]
MRITAETLSWAASGKTIIGDIDVEVASGETVGIIGPNGSGKSTLLRCLAGLRAPTTGRVRYDGEDIDGWGPRRIAHRLAFVEQAADTDSDLRLGDVVALGRTPFRQQWRGLDGVDHAVIDAALAITDLTTLRGRAWNTLSGGERQRAHIARALAQQPWAILLDEPTNHLDIKHQLELMALLAGTEQTVLVSLHDLALAAKYCDRLIMLHNGHVAAAGDPAEVLTPAWLAEVFEVEAETGRDRHGDLVVGYRSVVG